MSCIVPLAVLLCQVCFGQAPESESDKQSAQVRRVLGNLADALTAGNVSDAMDQFEKGLPDYDKLNNYFHGLVDAFYVTNEIEVLDENDLPGNTKLTLRWALTLTDLATNYTEDRSAELSVRLAGKGGKWRIADLSPITLFDPARGSGGSRRKP